MFLRRRVGAADIYELGFVCFAVLWSTPGDVPPERRMRYQECCLDFYIRSPAPDTVFCPIYQTQSAFGVVDKGVSLAATFIWPLSWLAVPYG